MQSFLASKLRHCMDTFSSYLGCIILGVILKYMVSDYFWLFFEDGK